ncbi:LysR family transcriptional regulator [Billgrantia aerodenitrificans]|uniref:LysR family transcriptional regulator n=1 Tax=Billgrantia aerodenitrificans TaxID=2733483 RepID=A0ABS9AN72_9GAMM|nr:LysR family transcriptional regulator [Halomonas aerodenitrificans]MCE8023199.1 LysR family transcriptional regulator [Halomonas aerodenitrificans]
MENIVKKLDLTSLRLFVAVCQEKNIARAAAREFITPSAVSRRIAEIESTVGLPMLIRHHRGISVTPAGEVVLRHAEDVLASLESLGAELSSFFSGIRGTVKISANLSSIVQFLPEDIASFKRMFPDVRVELEEQNTIEVIDMVARGEVDFGICNDIPETDNFTKLNYRADRLSVIMSRSHAQAGVAQTSFSSLLEDSFVALRGDSALTALLNTKAKALSQSLNVTIGVTSLDALCRMVDAGLGIAVVPHLVGEMYVNTLDVAVVPLKDDWALRQQVIVHNAGAALSASASKLVEFLAEGA